MAPKYGIGQQVIMMPLKGQRLSPRDSAIEPYAGQRGKVTDYHWITSTMGEVFHIYTVQAEVDNKDIVLYEDEIKELMY